MNAYPSSPSELGVRPAPALVNQLLIGAFTWMFAGVLLSAGVAWFVSINERLVFQIAGLALPLIIGQLILVFATQMLIPRVSATAGLLLFFAYAASIGLTAGVLLYIYTGESVAQAFLGASAIFGGAAIYGYTTKRSLVGIGPTLFMGMIGLLVASAVNLFLNSGPLGWIISIIGVVIFTIFTAYDVQRIANGDYAAALGSPEKASVLAALNLYVNFVAIFFYLLRILGGTRE